MPGVEERAQPLRVLAETSQQEQAHVCRGRICRSTNASRVKRYPRMLRHEKKVVREFYETFGWATDQTGTYNDTSSFVDLRPVLSAYYHDTQLRVRRFLKPSGTYFLDAGSGPVSQCEYVSYSAGYAYRVCIDLSPRAL